MKDCKRSKTHKLCVFWDGIQEETFDRIAEDMEDIKVLQPVFLDWKQVKGA